MSGALGATRRHRTRAGRSSLCLRAGPVSTWLPGSARRSRHRHRRGLQYARQEHDLALAILPTPYAAVHHDGNSIAS
jgi:hypothetical protein